MNETKNKKLKPQKTSTITRTPAAKKAPTAGKIPAAKTITKRAATRVSAAPEQSITTEAIAARAYTLWEQAGRPNGRDVEYWLQAESQLKHEQSFAA